MLKRVTEIGGRAVRAIDREIGSLEDFYFDDQLWLICYLVVRTGDWLPGRQILLSPVELHDPDWAQREIRVSLTSDELANSPAVGADCKLSRHHEIELVGYFGWAPHWHVPGEMTQRVTGRPATLEGELRCFAESAGADVAAEDGHIGRLADMIVDLDDWAVRYLAVEVPDRGGEHVLVSPDWLSRADWAARKLHLDSDCRTVQQGPSLPAGAEFSRRDENALYEHYRRAPYW